MRWMLLKDLQILRRSKLLVALLVIYPIAIATLMGFALSSGPEKPHVAFLNQVPENRGTIRLGDQKLDAVEVGQQVSAQERLGVAASLAVRGDGLPERGEHEVQRARRRVQEAHDGIGQTGGLTEATLQ